MKKNITEDDVLNAVGITIVLLIVIFTVVFIILGLIYEPLTILMIASVILGLSGIVFIIAYIIAGNNEAS